jgi:hypothetical protein
MLLQLRRPLRIVTAYVCACLAAGLLLSVIVVAKLPEASIREVLPGIFGAALALARIAGIVGLLPSIIAIAVFEWRGERRWSVQAAFAACLAAVACVVISGVLARPDFSDLVAVIGGGGLLGVASGSVYWAIAGRNRSDAAAAVSGSA